MTCLEAFKARRFETVKIQCIGPATLIQSKYDEDDAILRVYQHVEALLDGLQADEIILFLDEPALGYVGFDFVRLWEPIFDSFPVTRGVHTCGNMQWDQMFAAPIDIISFDASMFDISKYYDDRQGKRIAWGITDVEQVTDYQPGDLITGRIVKGQNRARFGLLILWAPQPLEFVLHQNLAHKSEPRLDARQREQDRECDPDHAPAQFVIQRDGQQPSYTLEVGKSRIIGRIIKNVLDVIRLKCRIN